MSQRLTVSDMYKYAHDNNLKLLSNYNATFWGDYVTNSASYDKLFNRMYSSFVYFYQDDDSVIATLTTDFIDEVQNHLLINTKKYEELYRVHVLQDSAYTFLGNVDYTEVMDRDKGTNGTYTEGTRQDDVTETSGSRVDTSENQVSAYNSSTYSNANKTTDNKGQQQDTSRLIKSAQVNSTDMDYTDNYTLTIKGKKGDKPIAEMIDAHVNTWTKYQFYSYIFNEICAELLLI